MEMSQMEGVDDAGEWHLTAAADEGGNGQNTCTVTEVQNTQRCTHLTVLQIYF